MDTNNNNKWARRALLAANIQGVILGIYLLFLLPFLFNYDMVQDFVFVDGPIIIPVEVLQDEINSFSAGFILSVLVPQVLDAMKYALLLGIFTGFWVLAGLYQAFQPGITLKVALRNARLWRTLNYFCFFAEAATIVLLIHPLVSVILTPLATGCLLISAMIVVIHPLFIFAVGKYIEELELEAATRAEASVWCTADSCSEGTNGKAGEIKRWDDAKIL